MEEKRCWVCGSEMLKKSIVKTQSGDCIDIICESCFAILIVTPIGADKSELRKLHGKDGKGNI